MSSDFVIWDLFRFLDLCLWIVSFGIAARVMVLYGTVYAKRHNPHERRASAGLLPLHVWVIALSWLILSASAASANIDRLGSPFTLYIPVNFIGFTLGLVALVIIMRYERRRVNPPEIRVQDSSTMPHEEEVYRKRRSER